MILDETFGSENRRFHHRIGSLETVYKTSFVSKYDRELISRQ